MKYLCLAYYDPQKFASMSPAAVEALVSQCPAHDAALRACGGLVMQASLGELDGARTILPKAGRPFFTDGPFTETKEQIGGFFIIDVEDLDQAVQAASMLPGATKGSVEVRPIWPMDMA
jgi:hypothetical protein